MTRTLESLNIRSVRDLELANRRVFVRCDFNVPLADDSRITDETRIEAALPTIRYIREQQGRPVLASHLGRPKGKRSAALSLEPVAARLAELLECDVLLPDDTVGDAAGHLIANQRPNQVVLLENLRFHPGEKADDEDFARRLSELVDVYVNDAFGALHRAHASVHALPKMMPERAAGLLIEREVGALSRLLAGVQRPYVAILGGAKVSDKVEIIEKLLDVVDSIVIGGAMAYTFLTAQGHDMGASLVERERLKLASSLLERCRKRGVEVHLPTDHVVVDEIGPGAASRVRANGEVAAGEIAVDLGPETVAAYTALLAGDGDGAAPRTILWNGPMGIFELDAFATGTTAVARAVAHTAAFSVVGGGDSVAAIDKAGVKPLVSHVSTGGGASLEYLSGKALPGLGALRGGRR